MSYKRVQVEGGIQTGNDLVLKSREAGDVAHLFRALLFVCFFLCFFSFLFLFLLVFRDRVSRVAVEPVLELTL